ncbi:hypothetical protein AB5J62_06320 [Amycolatopsis sp. cg5]|uniref:hypothetical protein n=1 Tax=Amycolatopsis sp. cg5 TaxID=3238802 RepID=UPI0035257507
MFPYSAVALSVLVAPVAFAAPYAGNLGPKGSVKVQIVDVDTGGKKGDLNLDKAAFAKIGAINNGIEKISWAVAP